MTTLVILLGVNSIAGAGGPSRVALKSDDASSARPSPGHLIVGPPIKLPSALFTSGAGGASYLVSPSEARIVATAMWNAWQTALYANDTKALTQLAAAGPFLNGTIYNCAFPSGRCLVSPHKPKLGQLEVVVPKQRAYPLYFMSAVRTTNAIQNSDGISQVEPWMDLQILTKASRAASWKLSFETGYDAIGGVQPPFPPFDFGVGPYGPLHSDRAYNGAPLISKVTTKGLGKAPTVVPTNNYLPLLAAYWQSYKDAGHAPKDSVFLKGGDSSGEGKSLAKTREGSLYNGSRDTYRFAFDPRAGTWRFTVEVGYPLVCGSVFDAATVKPLGGFLNQNSDEVNYGIPLPPGEYLSVTTVAEHPVCVSYALGGTNGSLGGLVVSGNDTYTSAVTGPRAPADLVDLETDYGVLSSELTQFGSAYNTCLSSDGKSCVKTFALNVADQFAQFDNALMSYGFPARFQVDVNALETSAVKINALYESVYRSNGKVGNMSSIKNSVKGFQGRYKKLERDLS
jgi:hypothetical protein